jgi:hypothetical protein
VGRDSLLVFLLAHYFINRMQFFGVQTWYYFSSDPVPIQVIPFRKKDLFNIKSGGEQSPAPFSNSPGRSFYPYKLVLLHFLITVSRGLSGFQETLHMDPLF